MGFQKQERGKCPSCNGLGVWTIESRKATHGQRRRKECSLCGHRFTTYEISSEDYAKYDHFLYMHEELCKRLGTFQAQPMMQDKIKCTTCHYNNGYECSFDFPEYNTSDSSDCNHYELETSV